MTTRQVDIWSPFNKIYFLVGGGISLIISEIASILSINKSRL